MRCMEMHSSFIIPQSGRKIKPGRPGCYQTGSSRSAVKSVDGWSSRPQHGPVNGIAVAAVPDTFGTGAVTGQQDVHGWAAAHSGRSGRQAPGPRSSSRGIWPQMRRRSRSGVCGCDPLLALPGNNRCRGPQTGCSIPARPPRAMPAGHSSGTRALRRLSWLNL